MTAASPLVDWGLFTAGRIRTSVAPGGFPRASQSSFFSLKVTSVWQDKKEIKTKEEMLLERLILPAESLAALDAPAQQT